MFPVQRVAHGKCGGRRKNNNRRKDGEGLKGGRRATASLELQQHSSEPVAFRDE